MSHVMSEDLLKNIDTIMPDGSVCAGLTADGMFEIFIMPVKETDLSAKFRYAMDNILERNRQMPGQKTDYSRLYPTLRYVREREEQKGNWQHLPEFSVLKTLHARYKQGHLSGIFRDAVYWSGSTSPDWDNVYYPPHPGHRYYHTKGDPTQEIVHLLDFSTGNELEKKNNGDDTACAVYVRLKPVPARIDPYLIPQLPASGLHPKRK